MKRNWVYWAVMGTQRDEKWNVVPFAIEPLNSLDQIEKERDSWSEDIGDDWIFKVKKVKISEI